MCRVSSEKGEREVTQCIRTSNTGGACSLRASKEGTPRRTQREKDHSTKTATFNALRQFAHREQVGTELGNKHPDLTLLSVLSLTKPSQVRASFVPLILVEQTSLHSAQKCIGKWESGFGGQMKNSQHNLFFTPHHILIGNTSLTSAIYG